MPYLFIADFKFGMDRRRKRVSGVPGTLWTLKNGHITRGGDIERAKKFVAAYSLPAGTFGLAKVSTQLYTFGSADLAGSMPRGVLYQRLQAPNSSAMTRVLEVKAFSGLLYVVAEYADGNIHHFYDGSRVTDWDAKADSNSDVTTLAEYLAAKVNASSVVSASSSAGTITLVSLTPGTAFTTSVGVVNRGADNTQSIAVSTVQANVAAVAETRATGTVTVAGGTAAPGVNTVSNVLVNGVSLMAVAVNWSGSNSTTAAAVAQAINNQTAIHGYSAAAVGATVTITAAPNTGATPNGYGITAVGTGDVSLSHSGLMSGGVAAVTAVAQIDVVVLGGLYETQDEYTITVNGTNYTATGRASGMGVSAFPHKQRMWSVAGTLFEGSKLTDPADWNDASTSSGNVTLDASNESEGSERLVCVGEYSSYAAVFGRTQIRLYQIETDATLISFYQSLDNTGTLAARSVVSYGNNDVYYLDPTGIRSIRARDVLNAAYVSDVGTALDSFVREHIRALAKDTVSRAAAVVEPIDGRYWLAMGERIYVLSYFPTSKITAWSYYEPGFSVSDFVRIGDALYARGGDTIYLYGGVSGTEYPAANETPITVELPFLSANSPANEKHTKEFGIACTNEWDIDMLIDPNDEAKVVNVGKINRTNFHLPEARVVGDTTHVALKLVCSSAGDATLSSLILSFDRKAA